MKKVLVAVVAITVLCFAGLAGAKSDLGFKGVGGQLSYVMPSGSIENSLGLGANVYLGTIMPDLHFFAYVDYWGKTYSANSYAEAKYSMISIIAAARYHFKVEGNIKPYAGGGLGLNIAKSSVTYNDSYVGHTYDTSVSNTDLGILLLGGASTSLSKNLDGFAELRYNIGDGDVFSINVGVTYLLGK